MPFVSVFLAFLLLQEEQELVKENDLARDATVTNFACGLCTYMNTKCEAIISLRSATLTIERNQLACKHVVWTLLNSITFWGSQNPWTQYD